MLGKHLKLSIRIWRTASLMSLLAWLLLLLSTLLKTNSQMMESLAYFGFLSFLIFMILAYYSYSASQRTEELLKSLTMLEKPAEANLLDINERPVAENTINYHAYLLETIPESVMVVDSSCRLVYLNQKAQEFYRLLQGRVYSLSYLLSKMGFNRDLFPTIKSCIEQGIPWQGEQQLLIEGKVTTFLHRLELWSNGQEEKSYLLISTDISALAESRERAHIANQTKTQFLANMSHEMRTPMIGILGSVSLLEQSDLRPEQTDSVAIVRECGEHLLGIINEILDVSKLDLGMASLHQTPNNLVEVLTHTVRLIEPLAQEKGLCIGLDIETSKDCTVVIDKIKLGQILLNILHNALKFTETGGINLHAKVDQYEDLPPSLLISVADTGIGIARENISAIFEPFSQADGSFSRTFGGTGLGLYICQKLADLKNGEIWLESQEGQGSIFYLRIPVELASNPLPLLEEDDASIPSGEENTQLLDFSPVQVLLVEDNRINHRIVAQMLNTYGFEVSTALHGLECLRLMQTRQFDIVLMDMQMPVMDGYEATMHICQDPQLRCTPVIAMTAHALSGDREKCLQCGCADYIAKPFRAEELVEVIQRNLKCSKSVNSPPENHNDRLVADLLPEFMDSLNDMVKDLYRALDIKDASAIQSISHDIKGSAGLYGLSRISDLAALIEQAARENMLHKVRVLAGSLNSVYEKLHTQVS